jgi:hypothetical protein
MNSQELIHFILTHGSFEKPVKAEQIKLEFNVSDRTIRTIVNQHISQEEKLYKEFKNGHKFVKPEIIGSDERGYYLINNRQQESKAIGWVLSPNKANNERAAKISFLCDIKFNNNKEQQEMFE